MDDLNPFGEPDTSVTVSQAEPVDLETIASGSTDIRPYLFEFSVVDDDRPRDGVARKAMTKFFAFKEVLKDPEALEDYGIEFRKWFKDKTTKDARKETHVSLNFASFHIEPDEEPLFLERYAVSIAAGRPFWMIERPTPVFRLFFDMDFKNLGPLTGFGIEAAALVTGRAVAKFFPNRNVDDPTENLRMIVCCTDIKKDTIEGPSGKVNVHKTGVHIHWPNVFVTGHQAMTIRESVIADLLATFGPRVPPQQNNWEDVIDSSVFYVDGREGSGLRMYAARKADKCPSCKGKPKQADGSWCKARGCRGGRVDTGRPYVLLFATDGTLRRSIAQEDVYLKNLHALIVDVTIRCHKDVNAVDGTAEKPGTEGFRVPAGAPLQVGKAKAKIQKGLSVGAVGRPDGTSLKSKDIVPGSLQDTLTSVIHEAFGHHYAQVVVNSAKQQMKDKTQIVNVTGLNAHQCQNIDREHKSNRIYFVVSPDGIVQRCQDPSDALTDEMRFGLCKTQASTMFPIPKRFRDLLWPKIVDDSTSIVTVPLEKPVIAAGTTDKLKILQNQGDFLCQKLQGSAWSVTLQFENNQKLLRSQSAQFLAVGPEDLGLRARSALEKLGFKMPVLEDKKDAIVKKPRVRFEKPLSELENNVWTTFHSWVNFVASLDTLKLKEQVASDGLQTGIDVESDAEPDDVDTAIDDPADHETLKMKRKRMGKEMNDKTKRSRLRERL